MPDDEAKEKPPKGEAAADDAPAKGTPNEPKTDAKNEAGAAVAPREGFGLTSELDAPDGAVRADAEAKPAQEEEGKEEEEEEPSPLEAAAAEAAERESDRRLASKKIAVAARAASEQAPPLVVAASREGAAEDVEEKEPPIPEVVDVRGWKGWIAPALAVLLPIVFFFLLPPLSKSGLWDPYELNVADLARRVAVNLHDADLKLDGADNHLPFLNDLGRPQAPITSIALGFKIFGLHEWAGRLPLAIWGLLGVIATYLFVARLFDKKAGLYAAAALTTMPLYFVQARTMLGDICIMSAIAMSFGGFAVAVFDRNKAGPTSPLVRLPYLAMGCAGLFLGFESRGAILGIGVPLVSVGAAWGLSWAAGKRKLDIFGDAFGVLSLVAGAVVLTLGFGAMLEKEQKDLSLLVGAMVKNQTRYPTFDFYVAHIGHALAPWSAFLPFAVGRLFVAPVGRSGGEYERESFAKMSLLVGLAVAFGVHGAMAAKTDFLIFCGVPFIAAACGVAIRDFERGAHASVALGLGMLLVCMVFHHDFHEVPDKAYQAFGITGATFPENFKGPSVSLWYVVLGGFGLVGLITWLERGAKRTPFDPAGYFGVIRALRNAWDGVLVLVWMAFVAAFSLAALGIWIGGKFGWAPGMASLVRDFLMNFWLALLLGPLAIIFMVYSSADLWLWAFPESAPRGKWIVRVASIPVPAMLVRWVEPFRRILNAARSAKTWEEVVGVVVVLISMLFLLPGAVFLALFVVAKVDVGIALLAGAGVTIFPIIAMGVVGDIFRYRAAGLGLVGVFVGAVLCFAYYPALANQLSPKEVFESYEKAHSPGEPLALLGVGSRTTAYYAGGQPQTFSDTTSAFQWLVGGEGHRRYLATKADDLAKLNQLFRLSAPPSARANLPILDARSSQILLGASSLPDGVANENPLDSIILKELPGPARKLSAILEDDAKNEVLEVVGIDVTDMKGVPVEAVAPGKDYSVKTYYRVLGKLTREWEAFIHIDGNHKRHNGDHKPMNGKYPMSLWLPGDLLVDDYKLSLEPNFSHGTYTIYFGLFVGEARLKVKSGKADAENRVDGGPLKVL